MNFQEFTDLISATSDPVILIEGRRNISPELAESARELASFLAKLFPRLKFRSGNASGSDEAFAAGVLEVSPERLQIIAPYASHRKKQRHPLALYDSPDSLSSEALKEIKAMTITATPTNKGLMKCFGRGGRTGAQAACLIRDTMKVAGMVESARRGRHALPPPTAALFCIDPADPEAGGTGHTIRVCRNTSVPVIFQDQWTTWTSGQ